MNNIKNMTYSEFIDWTNENPDSELILSYQEFQVWKDDSDGKYYYVECSINDASKFYELQLIGKLIYPFNVEINNDAIIESHNIFPDCDVSGEIYIFPDNDTIEYLYFKKV